MPINHPVIDDKPAENSWSKAKLPNELSGAKPKYGMANLEFASDLDKACYITRDREKRSNRDSDYLKWVGDLTGWSENQIRGHGAKIAAFIKVQPVGPVIAIPVQVMG
jgi:hypothetical protein